MNFGFDYLELRGTPGGSDNILIWIGTSKAPVYQINRNKPQSIVVYTEEISDLQNCFFDSCRIVQ